MIGANPIGIPIIKGFIILFGKNKDTKFNVTDYQCLMRKLIYLL